MMDESETLMTCPYNMAHSVRKGRIQIHLAKCRKQHPNSENVTCPFNASHVFPKIEYDVHTRVCPGRIVLDDFISNSQVGGDPPLPVLNRPPHPNIDFACEENWDDDIVEGSILESLAERIKTRDVFIKISGKPPSERKAHRKNERLRHQNINKEHKKN